MQMDNVILGVGCVSKAGLGSNCACCAVGEAEGAGSVPRLPLQCCCHFCARSMWVMAVTRRYKVWMWAETRVSAIASSILVCARRSVSAADCGEGSGHFWLHYDGMQGLK